MYAFRVEASLYRENCPKSAAAVLLKKTYQALFVFWEINLSFFSVCFTLKRTPSCSRLDTGGKVNLGISSLSRIHWYRLGATFRWSNQLLAKPTTAAHCRHILNKIYKFAQEQECPAVEEDRAASVESPPADQTMKLGSHRHQVPDQKPRPAPLFPAFSPFRVFPQMSWETKHFVLERGLAEEAEENRWDLVWILTGTSFGLAGVRPHSSKHFWI